MQKIFLAFFLCVLFTAAAAPATAATPWQWANPSPQGNTLNASITGNGTSVAVGGGGTIYSNPGGVWAAQSSPTANNLFAVAYGGGLFVAVGQAGAVITSTDGTTWSPATTPPTQNLFSIAFGSSTFVAAGSNGTAYYSSNDGQTWTASTIDSTSGAVVTSVAFGKGVFVAIVHEPTTSTTPGATQIYYSANGTTWTLDTVVMPNDPPVNLSFNGTIFVAMGLNVQGTGGGSIMTSPDGKTWTTQSALAPATAFPISIAAGANGAFVVMLQSGEDPAAVTTPILIETSTDGVTWTPQATNDLPAIWSKPIPRQLCYTGSGYLVVGASAYIASSPDLVNWTSESPATSVTYAHLRGVHWINNQYFAVGDADTVLTSPDGVTWTNENAVTNIPAASQSNLREIAYNGSRYVAVGSNGVVLTSADGTNWSATTITPAVPAGTVFQGLTWGGNQFVAVGSGGAIYTSPDGLTWTAQTSGTSPKDTLWGVAWTGTNYVVVSDSNGDNTRILISSDGVHWTSVPFAVSNFPFVSLYGIHWNGHELIVSGGAATSSLQLSAFVATSPDGETWNILPAANVNDVFTDAILNGDNLYAALSQSSGNIYTSTDGSNWTPQISTIQDSGMQNLATHCGTRVATGYGGVILYSITQPPTASDGAISTKQGSAVNATLAACGGTLSFQTDTLPAHGTVTITGPTTGAFTYTPANGFSGTDSFTFTASNSAGVSAPATETVSVSLLPPTAENGSLSTTEGTAASGTLQATGSATSFAVKTNPAHGTVTITDAATGAFTYTPASGFTGTDSFTFTASNAGGTSNAATETVSVSAAPPPPPPPPPPLPAPSGGGGGGGLGILGLLALALLFTGRSRALRPANNGARSRNQAT